MEISALIAQIRTTLSTMGGGELPPFPGVLPVPWYHPDLLAWLFGPTEGSRFGFPLIPPSREGSALRDACRPGFIWARRPFHPAWLARIQELLLPLGALAAEEPRASSGTIDLTGLVLPETLESEVGAAWRLWVRGVPTGELRVVTAIGGEILPQPTGLLTIELATLAAILRGDVAGSVPPWARDWPCDDVLAWKEMAGAEPAGPDAGEALTARVERCAAAFDQALNRKTLAALLRGLADLGRLWNSLEDRGQMGTPAGREAQVVLRGRFRKGVAALARAAAAVPSGKPAKEGVLR
ncbi:MAG: hypothetical protein OZSIB_0745 [Candidatus Ozemobacter sibiricus]|jgi:hypothetical protein|uniref:Uncharacterized protein n=1 Tax=Candidatus Ozemobacter sibiricus TaxID=2268124 RepID=A0A367ZWA9_9BACT|nr:MAG: hypothetical protein OZSIB_0745 [Candidatus Ozemobacter sibiricus]